MEVAAHQAIPVVEPSQPSAARFAARQLADHAGFAEADSYRAGLVATELATNLAKHARAGQILVRSHGACVELIAVDRGPGMANPAAALADGHSTAGTNGIGLGAVKRLSDEFDLFSTVPHGTVVFARIRPRPAAPSSAAPFTLAGVSVAKPGETDCGDAWSLEQRQEGFSAFLADGLGHGPFAAQAATTAVAAATLAAGRGGCARTLETVHEAVRHTRGAAAAIAELALSRRLLTFAGVGNVTAAIVDDVSLRHAVSQNGTLGHQVRTFREFTYPWPAAALLVMHSDGLSSHWSLAAYPGLRQRHAAVIAALLYRDFSRGRDDVAVVVAKETP